MSAMSSGGPNYKVVMLGDSGVGKTASVIRLNEQYFRQVTAPTVGSGVFAKVFDTEQGRIKLTIWDTAGEERYRSFTSLYTQNAAAAIIVYDITDKYTFISIPSWIEALKAITPSCIVFIVGNKLDLEDKRDVEFDKALEWCTVNGYKYYETSAKTGQNIESLFNDVVCTLAKSNALVMDTRFNNSNEKQNRCC